nr:hypothetical protein [Tanacetum cinerariifolium]
YEAFYDDHVKEISSGSTTTHSDISLPEYEAFYDDHVKEISSGSTTTHSNSSLYDSFIFDLSINPFPPADRSDFYEFADELAHIISPPEYDCFCFKNEPNLGDFAIDVVEDTLVGRTTRGSFGAAPDSVREGCNILSEKLLDLDLHPPLHDNPLSGSTTYPLLEEFVDELPSKYDDNLQFDIKSDLKEIEFLLYQYKDSSLKDSIDQKNHALLANIFVDSISEMFTDEHTLDYSSPPIFDVYADDFFEVESDAENIYNDPFDSKGEKIKESKLLIDELDLPCDFHPPSEYDSFFSQDFSRVDALPSTNNEDKVFNPCIIIQEKPVKIITVVQDKKLLGPPFYEPLFFKEVPKSKMLLPFSSENEKKVFKPGIHTSEKVHLYFIPELSHQGYKVFIINQIFKSLMKIFFSTVERTPTSWLFLITTFNPLINSKGCNILSEKLLDLDLHPPLQDNPLSGSTIYPLLKAFADELPPEYDDNLQFDIESDLKEIEFPLYQDKDSSLKDSIDQKNRALLADIFVDYIPEMFIDEHTLDYSSPSIFDVYADDF